MKAVRRRAERFHGTSRDELLNGEMFTSVKEAQVLAQVHRVEYNERRPHSALGCAVPSAFARRRRAGNAALRKAPLRPPAASRPQNWKTLIKNWYIKWGRSGAAGVSQAVQQKLALEAPGRFEKHRDTPVGGSKRPFHRSSITWVRVSSQDDEPMRLRA